MDCSDIVSHSIYPQLRVASARIFLGCHKQVVTSAQDIVYIADSQRRTHVVTGEGWQSAHIIEALQPQTYFV